MSEVKNIIDQTNMTNSGFDSGQIQLNRMNFLGKSANKKLIFSGIMLLSEVLFMTIVITLIYLLPVL
jgi:hypothetical protein